MSTHFGKRIDTFEGGEMVHKPAGADSAGELMPSAQKRCLQLRC